MYSFPIPEDIIPGYPFAAFVGHLTGHVTTAFKFQTLAGVLRAKRLLDAANAEDKICRWKDGDFAIVRDFIEQEDPEKAVPMPQLGLTRKFTDEAGNEKEESFDAPAVWFAPYVQAILDAKHEAPE